MDVILIWMVSLMLSFALCEGVFVLRKITITIDEGTLECLNAFREVYGIPFSACIRRAVSAYYQVYQVMSSVLSAKKN